MSDDKRTVRVSIFGEDYNIRSEMGEKYTLACARHVDDAIQEVHVRGHVSQRDKAAILAALQITDELFRGRSSQLTQSRSVMDRATSLTARIEDVLAGGDGKGTTAD